MIKKARSTRKTSKLETQLRMSIKLAKLEKRINYLEAELLRTNRYGLFESGHVDGRYLGRHVTGWCSFTLTRHWFTAASPMRSTGAFRAGARIVWTGAMLWLLKTWASLRRYTYARRIRKIRYKLKKDEAHAKIARELLEAGFSVADTSRVGGGFPDLAISRNNVCALVEIKTLKYLPKMSKTAVKTPSDHRSAGQIKFHSQWKGPIITAYNSSQVIYEFNMLVKRREGWALWYRWVLTLCS
jgi:hypothetical protein